jgi:arylsulfatase A-like enzyme
MGLTHAPWWWKLNEGERHTAAILKGFGYETYLIGFNHIDHNAHRLGYDKVLSTKRNAAETVRETRDLIQNAQSMERPFFVKVGFNEVHRPFGNGTDIAKGVFVPKWMKRSQDVKDDLSAFQATIKYFDELVGGILDCLEKNTIACNTMVIMTSDHGIPYPGAKWTVRKAGIEVPLIVYQPDTVFSGGKLFTEVMSNVDVLPTLLNYLGEEIPANMQGCSFMDLIEAKTTKPPRREAFSQYTPEMKRDNVSRSIITNRYHLIRYFSEGRAVDYPVDVNPQTFASHEQRCKTRGTRPFAQLFDIKKDPYELNDIGAVQENTAIVAALSRRLLAWMQEVKDPLLDGPLRTPYYDRAITDLKNAE